MRCSGAVLLLLLAVPSLPGAASPSGDRQRIERGRQIYLQGTSPSGGEIVAVMSDAGVEVPAAAVPCAGCHGRDGKGKPEGGVAPSDLTWPALTRPYGVVHPGGRRHPPYDEKLLKRAISMGVDSAGQALNAAMPRFRLSLQDMEDLVAYLRHLGTGTDPGVSDEAVRVGVVLPPAGPLGGLGKAVRAALTARFAAANRDGGVYGRRVEPVFFEAPGPADQRRGWTADFLQREEVFAGVAPFFAGADAEMAALFQEKQVPVVGPFSLHPQEEVPLNRYVFYLSPGLETQEKALAGFVAKAQWPRPVVLRAGEPSAELRRLAAAGTDPVLFSGSGPEALALLREADRLGWHPRLLATGAAADGSLLAAPAAFDGKLFLALPSAPAELAAEAVAAWRALGKLPADNLSAQWSALAAAEVLLEGLKRAGRDLRRETLVDQLESLSGFATAYAPPVTFGPARRLGARGAWVVAVSGRGPGKGGWVAAE
jgi:ABC-type branched-subunit amino acid transport system substrate-binding protein